MFSGVLISAVLCACVILWWRARLRESRAHPLPPALPNQLPVIGIVHKLFAARSDLWSFIKTLANDTAQLGGLAYANVGTSLYYLVTDPEDALTVSNKCLAKPHLYSFGSAFLGQGLITSSVEIWQRHRKQMNPMFNLPAIYSFLEVFNSQSKALLSNLDLYIGKGKIDIRPELKKIVLETSCLTAFGKRDMKSFLKYLGLFEKYMEIAVQRFLKFWLHSDKIYKLLGQKKKEDELVKYLKEVTEKTIQDKKQSSINGSNSKTEYASTDMGYEPFLDRMLREMGNDPFTDQELREEMDTLLITSYDTSVHFFGHLLALIGSYPDVQEKLYQEIMQVVGPDRDLIKNDLPKLVYTSAVLKEALRIMPTVPGVARFVDKDLKLKNYTLRAGTQCIILLSGILRHHSWGADVDQFRPERWLDPATLPKNPNTFAAFSIGKRACIGQTYAMTSAKVMLAHVVRKYRLTADHTKIQIKYEVLLKSIAGHEIIFQRRD